MIQLLIGGQSNLNFKVKLCSEEVLHMGLWSVKGFDMAPLKEESYHQNNQTAATKQKNVRVRKSCATGRDLAMILY